MKDNEFKIDIPEDRGTLDLTRRIEELENTIKGYDFLLESLKKEIFEAKKVQALGPGTVKLFRGSRIMELEACGFKLDACCLGLEACGLMLAQVGSKA
jgi:hypothetical protein